MHQSIKFALHMLFANGICGPVSIFPALRSSCRSRSQAGLGRPRRVRAHGRIAQVYDDLDALMAVVRGLPRHHVLVMSNGGFGSIHEKLLKALVQLVFRRLLTTRLIRPQTPMPVERRHQKRKRNADQPAAPAIALPCPSANFPLHELLALAHLVVRLQER